MARILVLGAGFAGLWAAIGAARKLDEIGVNPGEAEILVVDRNPYHNIRVRNYEVDLSEVAIPLSTGRAAKVTKQTINHKRIYPPRAATREAILAAAAPIVQAPPQEVRVAAAM